MADLSAISVILPSLNPDEKLLGTVRGLLEEGFSHIILINDGSDPEKMSYFQQAAAYPQVQLLQHPVNRGKGAALKTGFRYFLEHCPQGTGVVTADGDGQHKAADIRTCALRMAESGRVILGVRDFSGKEVPARSRFGNRCTSAVFKIFVGMPISDTQTGLRAIPRQYLEALCDLSGDRFEYETNMLLAFKDLGIPYAEEKIRTVYMEENKSSHFHPLKDSWRIYRLILAHFFRYSASSLICAAVDEGLYALLAHALQGSLSELALSLVPGGIARLCSSLLNFCLNKHLVFHSRSSTGKALLRYYGLAIPQAVAQLLLDYGLNELFRVGSAQTGLRALIHLGVMVVLFVVSFMIQQRWVFAPEKEKGEEP